QLAGDGAGGEPADPAVGVDDVGASRARPAAAQAVGEVADVGEEFVVGQRAGRPGVQVDQRGARRQPGAAAGGGVLPPRVHRDLVRLTVGGQGTGERTGEVPNVDGLQVFAVKVGGGHERNVQRAVHTDPPGHHRGSTEVSAS